MNETSGNAPVAVQAMAGRIGCRRHWLHRCALLLALIFALPFAWPDHPVIPVAGATRADWNPRSFWYYPWGASGVHKGIDIFAPEGRPVLAATSGLVLVSGFHGDGGNMIAVLGPRWRIHYYAHLSRLDVAVGRWVGHGDAIGAVGSTGNAAGKPSHLHYAIVTVVPYPWRITAEPQGWKKMFFLDPRIELAD